MYSNQPILEKRTLNHSLKHRNGNIELRAEEYDRRSKEIDRQSQQRSGIKIISNEHPLNVKPE